MQYFAAFKNLYALHLIALRSGDRGILLQNESLEFAVDSLSHCPNMKLKYIAIANSVVALELKPEYLNHHMTIALERLRDKKGKGKAHNDSLSSLMDSIEDSASEEVDGFLAQMMAGKSRLKILLGGFGDADEVRIFARQIRLGKL